MKYIIVLFLLLQVNVFAQEKTQLDRKYLTALIYLKTNNEIKDKIIKFKKHWEKSKRRNFKTDDNFNLSKYVVFLSIPEISENKNQSHFLSSDIKLLENKYFESIEIDTFNKLFPSNNSNFYLFFSKPVGNYLVAELLLISSGNEMDLLSHRQGPTMNIMFQFDEDDVVQQVYISSFYYN